MKRLAINAAFASIVMATAALQSPVRAIEGDGECKTPSGGVCTGEPCCVYGDFCSTDEELCKEILCQEMPELPSCQPD